MCCRVARELWMNSRAASIEASICLGPTGGSLFSGFHAALGIKCRWSRRNTLQKMMRPDLESIGKIEFMSSVPEYAGVQMDNDAVALVRQLLKLSQHDCATPSRPMALGGDEVVNIQRIALRGEIQAD